MVVGMLSALGMRSVHLSQGQKEETMLMLGRRRMMLAAVQTKK